MAATKIEWSDAVWNPTTGCDRVSPGCDNCYALSMAGRLKAMGQAKYQTDGRPETSGPGFGVQVHADALDEPFRWRKPRRVFVNSMSDLFHPQVPDWFIAQVFAVMGLARDHTFQVLTKRPRRMAALVARMPGLVHRAELDEWPLPNVWLGTSVEDQERAEQRIPPLLDTPAAVRFLSCEPLLASVDLSRWLDYGVCRCPDRDESESKRVPWHHGECPIASNPDGDLHWVIVGGESGPGARPMHLGWARSLVEQCRDAGVAPFVKQLGSHPVYGVPARAEHRYKVNGKGGDPDEWPSDLRVREFPDTTLIP